MTDFHDQFTDPDEEPVLVIRLRLSLPAPAEAPPGARPMRVVTEGAIYEFEPDAMTAVRLRRDGAELRRDGEQLKLLIWPNPVVGYGMELQLMVREDSVPTVRQTSAVLRIERES